MSKGTSTIELSVRNPQGEDDVALMVTFDWWYDPGVRYFPDGTGYPPDSGMEMVKYETVDGGAPPEWLTDEMVEAALDKADFDYFGDYEEPDFDY